MPAYSWLTFAQAKAELALRLGDTGKVFWTDAEMGAWITEALRVWNALTAYWTATFSINLTPPLAQNWFAANGNGSPRKPTLTDGDVYTWMEYHLLEPPSGSTWTGTNQFSISDLSQACSNRRNEILQLAACNMAESSLSATPNTSSVQISDLFIDVRRVRWVPAAGQGNPVTLQRGDSRSFQYFSPSYRQTAGNPLRWDVIGEPPQVVAVDALVNVPSKLQVLGMQGGAAFAPPTNAPLLMPDDWAWVLKFGALSDVLSKEKEGKDPERAAYCRQRYDEGIKLMQFMPWITQGFVNDVPVDTQPLAGADRTNYEWQSRSVAFPELVVGGIDLFALSPTPTIDTAASLTVVQNAPVPAIDADPIQVPRDVMAAILDESQHLALFKMGGASFQRSMVLHRSFMSLAASQNSRLLESGILASTIRPPVDRQDEAQPRYLENKE